MQNFCEKTIDKYKEQVTGKYSRNKPHYRKYINNITKYLRLKTICKCKDENAEKLVTNELVIAEKYCKNNLEFIARILQEISYQVLKSICKYNDEIIETCSRNKPNPGKYINGQIDRLVSTRK